MNWWPYTHEKLRPQGECQCSMIISSPLLWLVETLMSSRLVTNHRQTTQYPPRLVKSKAGGLTKTSGTNLVWNYVKTPKKGGHYGFVFLTKLFDCEVQCELILSIKLTATKVSLHLLTLLSNCLLIVYISFVCAKLTFRLAFIGISLPSY